MIIRDIAIAFGYEVDAKSEKKVNDSIDKLKSVAIKALGAIGIGFSLLKMNEVVEEFGKINSQIKNATKNLGDQKDIQNKIMEAANESRSAYADIAGLTSKLVQSSSELFDVEKAAKYAELTTKLFKSENKSQSEILNLQEEINKSFAKGAVESGTINQILEKSPAAADMLAKYVGVARTDLTKMASDGRISLTQLRDAFLNNADSINDAFSNVDMTITDALLNARNQWGLWLTQMDKTLGVTNNIAKFITRAFTKIMNVLRKAQVYTERLAKAVGGSENMFKLLAIAAGAIFAALNADKILAFLKATRALLTALNLKILALIAVILLIALAVDDFINFMQGNGSIIGEILKRWGIDADEVRKAIIVAWEGIKSFLVKTWEFLKNIGKTVWTGLTKFWTDHSDKVKDTLFAAWNAIRTVLEAHWNALKTIAFVIFSALAEFWETWGSTIISIFGSIWDLIGKNFDATLAALTGIFNLFAAMFKGDWEGIWNSVKDITSAACDAITNSFTAATDIIASIFSKLYDILGPFAAVIAGITAAVVAYEAATAAMAIVQGIMAGVTSGLTIAQIAQKIALKDVAVAQWLLNAAMSANPIGVLVALIVGLVAAFVLLWNKSESFRNFFIGMWEGIKTAFGAIVDWFKKAVSGIADFFIAVWEGIKPFFQGVWDFFVDIVKAYISIWIAIFTTAGNLFKTIWSTIASFFTSLWEELTSVVENAADIFKSMFGAAADFFKNIWSGVSSFFTGLWGNIVNTVASSAEKIIAYLSPILDTIGRVKDAVSNVKGVVGGAVNKAAEILGFAKGTENTPDTFVAGEKGPELIAGAKGKKVFTASKTSGIFGAIGDAFKTVSKVVNTVKDVVPGLRREQPEEIKADVTVNTPKVNNNIGDMLNNAVKIIADKFPKIKEAPYKAGANAKISDCNVIDEENDTEDVKALKRKAQEKELSGNKKSFDDIAAAIKSVGGMVNDSSKLIADKFSQAKETADKTGISDALKSFGSNILSLAQSATASPGTVQSMVTSTTNRSVTQNNYFESTFNGERAAQKRSSEAMNKNAEDATGALARALAYAR